MKSNWENILTERSHRAAYDDPTVAHRGLALFTKPGGPVGAGIVKGLRSGERARSDIFQTTFRYIQNL